MTYTVDGTCWRKMYAKKQIKLNITMNVPFNCSTWHQNNVYTF